jgi:N-acyl-D-aspartate/D-glutamate deacylase
LQEGYVGDVVVFDFGRIAERATYSDPHQLSEGVMWVLVNGTIAVQEGKPTGSLAGEVLRPSKRRM